MSALPPNLHGGDPDRPTSALGQKGTLQQVQTMSALPPKADILRDVRDEKQTTPTSYPDAWCPLLSVSGSHHPAYRIVQIGS